MFFRKFFIFFAFLIFALALNANSANQEKSLYSQGVLDNGLKYIVVERKGLPLVSIGIMIKSGVYQEEKPGLANLTASALLYGNKYMRAADVISYLDFIGASYSAGADYDYTTIGLSMRSNTAERVLKVVSRIVKYPVFNKNIFSRLKLRTLTGIKARKDNIADEARMEFYKTIYGAHPYSRSALGDIESVGSITRADIIGFHKNHYLPNNCVIAIVGDITFKRASKIVKRYFSNWKRGKLPPAREYSIPPAKASVKIINYPVTQGFVRMGHVSFRRNNPMYYKNLVLNAILGGSGFGSRLTEVIREKFGLTYGIVSYFYVYRKHEGYFHINFSTKLDKIKFAVKKVYEVVNDFLKKGPTEEELENIKNYLRGSLIMQRETHGQLVSYILSGEAYGLEKMYWLKEDRIISSLTLGDVKKACKSIHAKNFSVVVIADLSKVKLKKADFLNR